MSKCTKWTTGFGWFFCSFFLSVSNKNLWLLVRLPTFQCAQFVCACLLYKIYIFVLRHTTNHRTGFKTQNSKKKHRKKIFLMFFVGAGDSLMLFPLLVYSFLLNLILFGSFFYDFKEYTAAYLSRCMISTNEGRGKRNILEFCFVSKRSE